MIEIPKLEPPRWGRPLCGPLRAELTPATMTSHQLVADAGTINGLIIRAASVAGTMHQLGAQPRQDAYHVRSAGRLVAAAVCDGVGSAADAEDAATVASHTATRCALELFSELLPGAADIKESAQLDYNAATTAASLDTVQNRVTLRAQTLVDTVAQALLDLADDRLTTPNEVLTTLVCVIIAPHDPDVPVIAIRVGDSNARTLDDTGSWVSVFNQVERDGPTNRVDALPVYRTPELAMLPFPDSGPLLLVSDGIDVPMAGSLTVAAGLAQRWMTPPTPASFINDVQFVKVDAFDDRTAVALWLTTE